VSGGGRWYSCAEFVEAASVHVRGQKADRRRWLADFYATAAASVGIPVSEDSEAVRMFRLLLD
jgi:hypothetical protein